MMMRLEGDHLIESMGSLAVLSMLKRVWKSSNESANE
jgi:hypothetical protein